MKLSVITATRNVIRAGRSGQLARCLESVAAIRLPHEHLVCDGASTDGTQDLLSRAAKSHPDLIGVSEPDRGVYDAFNKGVLRARGKWIYFLGSDDWVFDPEALERAIAAAEKGKVEFVISLVRNSDGSNWFSGRKDFCNILITKSYGHQGVLMTRDLILRLGLFDADYRIASDYKLCLRAHLENVPFLLFNRAFAEFSVAGGLSNTDHSERWERLQIASAMLGVGKRELPLLMSRQLLPLRLIGKLLWHRSAVIRQGARYALARRCADWVGLLDENGSPRAFQHP